MATGFSAAFATAASAASAAPPAPGVAPGAYNIGSTRFVVYTGTDRAVWEKQVGSTSPATSLGGRLVSAPSPISVGPSFNSTRIVFGQGTDNALWMKAGNGPWTSLGGYLTSKPGAAVLAFNYGVYVRGGDGAVWARYHAGIDPATGWDEWHRVGGAVLAGTGPSAAALGGGTTRAVFWVLVAGTNRGLFVAEGEGSFSAAGGVTNSSPALVDAPSSGSLVGFAQGTTGAGYFHRFLATTPGWTSLGGILTSGMGGTSTDTNWYAYALGQDNQVWEHAGATGATGSWTKVTP